MVIQSTVDRRQSTDGRLWLKSHQRKEVGYEIQNGTTLYFSALSASLRFWQWPRTDFSCEGVCCRFQRLRKCGNGRSTRLVASFVLEVIIVSPLRGSAGIYLFTFYNCITPSGLKEDSLFFGHQYNNATPPSFASYPPKPWCRRKSYGGQGGVNRTP